MKATICVCVLLSVICTPLVAVAQTDDESGLFDRWREASKERQERRAQRRQQGAATTTAQSATPALSAGTTCQTQALRPGMHKMDMDFRGTERSYELHVPSTYDARQAMPLVLSFHGGGGRGKSQRDLTGLERIGERESFITAYPDGIRRSWNGGDGDTSYAEKNRLDDVGFVAALIDDISQRACVDPRRVYASGFSNGGRLTQRLGCELADRLAAIAPISAPMPMKIAPQCKPARPIPVIEMHATTDQHSPYDGGATNSGNAVISVPDTIAAWVKRNGCQAKATRVALPIRVNDGTSVVVDTYGGCAADAEVVLYTIEGAGHTWSDGMQYMSEAKIGKTSRQFSASEEIWAFFKRHPMP